MRFKKLAILSLSWLALGCDLFSKSDNNSHGENAPVMYGTGAGSLGGIVSGGGAGASGTKADAAVTGGASGGGVHGDGGPGATSTGGADAGKTPADAAIHDGAQRWVGFGSYTFAKCTWFSATDGFCTQAPSLSGQTLVMLFKTTDGGKTWNWVGPIDIQTSAPNASINVYVMSPTDMWFISGSLGPTQSGSIGHSIDGGKTWTSLTATVNATLGTPSGDGGVASVPLWQLAVVGGRVWLLPQGASLLVSQDGGVTWKKVVPPSDFALASTRSLIATQNNLLLSFLATDNSLGLYRWNASAFYPVEGAFLPPRPGIKREPGGARRPAWRGCCSWTVGLCRPGPGLSGYT